jgi:hypothetical protein
LTTKVEILIVTKLKKIFTNKEKEELAMINTKQNESYQAQTYRQTNDMGSETLSTNA